MNLPAVPRLLSLLLGLTFVVSYEINRERRRATSIRPQRSIATKRQANRVYEKWQFKVGSLADADTLRVVKNGRELQLKLCGIETPQQKSELALESRDYLESLVAKGDGTIFITPVTLDKYGNTVAELFVPIGDQKVVLLNSQMVSRGYAWHDKKHSSNCPSRRGLVIAERIAREKKLGVWK